MYPNNPNQQPGQLPPQPQGGIPQYPPQPGQSQGYPAAPSQMPQETPVNPWQQTPQQPQMQQQPQPSPTWTSAPRAPLAYNDPVAPITPDGIAPIDYLEQIAPKQKAKFGFSRMQIAIAGGVLLLGFLGFAIVTLTQGSKPNIGAMSQQVATKIATTAHITKESRKNLKSRELDTISSNLNIQLTNAGTGLTDAFAKVGVNIGNAKDATQDDTSVEVLEKLEEAQLNSVFDRTYAREISYRLTTILLQLKAIYDMSQNDELRSYLDTTYKNLEPFQKQLEAYNAKTS